jgi:GNAT superfamily N-acetyltransferase
MYISHAQQIADLLNRRNELAIKYDTDRITQEVDHYLYRVVNDEVVACVEVKPVQWYQTEILHLTVKETHEGKGFARNLLAAAIDRATSQGKRLAQCTIREGNHRSETLFAAIGFTPVSRFLNPQTRNIVGVWQKVLVPPEGT